VTAQYIHVRLESNRFACDSVHVAAMRGREGLGVPFDFDLDIAVLDARGLDVDTTLGAEATLVFETRDGEVRRVHGMVAAVTDLLRVDDACLEYRLRFVPRVHRLTFVETQEVFLSTRVPDILVEKLRRAGLHAPDDIRLRLQATYPPRDLVVQYRESDLAFISHLAENVGITLSFDHSGKRDRVVFSDSNAGFPPIAGDPAIPFDQPMAEAHIAEIATTRAVLPTRHYVVDYNDQHLRLDLTATHNGVTNGAPEQVVEYGAMHRLPEEGKQIAQVRTEARAAGKRGDVDQHVARRIGRLRSHWRRSRELGPSLCRRRTRPCQWQARPQSAIYTPSRKSTTHFTSDRGASFDRYNVSIWPLVYDLNAPQQASVPSLPAPVPSPSRWPQTARGASVSSRGNRLFSAGNP
jgi:uncharacterized protein involved in type VI secretion and phage assembly